MRRQLLGVAEGPDAVAHPREPVAVVPDHLLRPQERRRPEPDEKRDCPPVGSTWFEPAEVVAEADRGVLAEEDRAGVRDEVERGARVARSGARGARGRRRC